MPRANSGGKRERAGRKAGMGVAERIKSLQKLESLGHRKGSGFGVAKIDMGKPLLPQISVRQQAFLKALVTGQKVGEALDNLGIPRVTYDAWRKYDWWQQVVEEALVKWVASPMDVFRPRVPKALEALDERLEEGSLEAATSVFDRVYGKPIVRSQQEVRGAIEVVFARREDSEVIEGSAKVD